MNVAVVQPHLKRVIDVIVGAAVAADARGPGCTSWRRSPSRSPTAAPCCSARSGPGMGNRPFKLFKLRSMERGRRGAAGGAAATATSATAARCSSSTDDPRVTRVGAILRATSIDEIPQLFNVLRGEMSLVGPRPALPGEVAAFDADLLVRQRGPPRRHGPVAGGGTGQPVVLRLPLPRRVLRREPVAGPRPDASCWPPCARSPPRASGRSGAGRGRRRPPSLRRRPPATRPGPGRLLTKPSGQSCNYPTQLLSS